MSVSKRAVPRQFSADFDFVATHYGFGPGTDEYQIAKAEARADLENAIVCFTDLAALVRRELA
jgi:hypothetical protein